VVPGERIELPTFGLQYRCNYRCATPALSVRILLPDIRVKELPRTISLLEIFKYLFRNTRKAMFLITALKFDYECLAIIFIITMSARG
jgi:hypothetical protein